jgi:acetylornithine deacetylase/succinyl-diaminopimelate desuccinylase-like protein
MADRGTAELGTRTIGDFSSLPAVREAMLWFSREKQWINERHLQLCRVPAPTFFEKERAEWMAEQFRQLGCEANLDKAGNVVASWGARRGGPYLALTAHLDTVLAPRKPEEIGFGADGKLYGPGVADNGAGLVALLAVASAVKSLPDLEEMLGRVLLVANVGEEGEGNLSGMRYLCQKSTVGQQIRGFLVLDGPNTDHITHRALASRRFDIQFTGPGGHSWSDAGVANPVHALCRAITLFTEQRTVAQTTPRCSFNFGVIEGGTTVNSIPTHARAKVDLRSESASRIDELTALLTGCVERSLEVENDRASAGRIQAKVKEIGARPGGQLAEDAPLLKIIRAVDNHLGIRAYLDCASTDANIPLSLGIPALSIGAGGQGAGAHTPGEWFHPDGRDIGLQRILLTLCWMAQELE